MSNVSRSRLAKAYVSLMGTHDLRRLNLVLAHYVVTNKMTNQVDLLLNDINEELLRQQGRIDVTVTSVHELNESIKNDLVSLIKHRMGAKHVHLESEIDKSILGGLIAQTLSHEFDFSLATKLRGLRV